MLYTIKILEPAAENLRSIKEYYTESFSTSTAEKVISSIFSVIERLGAFPKSGKPINSEALAKLHFRVAFSQKHTIIYKLIDEEVVIFNIVNTKQNYAKLLYHEP